MNLSSSGSDLTTLPVFWNSRYMRSTCARSDASAIFDVIQRSGFPPVHLSEINFQAMYEQQRAQQAAGDTSAIAGTATQ